MTRKILATATAILIIATVFTGCRRDKEINPVDKAVLNQNAAQVSEFWEEKDQTITSATTTSVTTTTTSTTEDSNVEATEEATEKVEFVERSMTPHRAKLSKKEKKLYDEMSEAIFSYKEFTIDPVNGEYSEQEFINAEAALKGDKPELRLFLYVSNEYADEGYATKMTACPSYNWRYEDVEFDTDYMDSYIDSMNKICDEIIGRMPQKSNLYEKYEFLAREICNMTTYVDKSENEELYSHETGDRASWAYCYMNGPILYGEGVCQAYAYAYQYLCNRAGLWCITTTGYSISGVAHAWNIIMLEDGSTFHADLTWADAEEEKDGFDESYFLLTQAEIEVDHIHEEAADWAATGKN